MPTVVSCSFSKLLTAQFSHQIPYLFEVICHNRCQYLRVGVDLAAPVNLK